MSDTEPTHPEHELPHDEGGASPPARWRDVWQAPLLVGGALILVGGAVAALMTRPKPDINSYFRAAEAHMTEKEYGDAIGTLNDRVLPLFAKQALTKDQQRAFYLMRARALYLGQVEKGVELRENHEAIAREYADAERLEATLEAEDQRYVARTLLALGEVDKAIQRIEKLPESERELRLDLTQVVIERCLEEGGEERQEQALQLLTSLAGETSLSDEQRLWALSRQAKLLVAQGYYDDAATRILRTLPRVMAQAQPQLRAEILVVLARAYIGQDEPVGAATQLDLALEAVGAGHPLSAEVHTLLGEVMVRQEKFEPAQEHFRTVVEGFEFSPLRAQAMLGLAQTEARLARDDQGGVTQERAIARYRELVELLEDPRAKSSVSREEVAASLMDRFQEQFDTGDTRTSLRYQSLAESLFEEQDVPTGVILGAALARRQLAEELLGRDGVARTLRALSAVDPTTQREAKDLLLSAGAYSNRYAARVVQTDTRAYAEALWNAADSFDRAGDTEGAIRAFQQFASDFPSDGRQPEARFRLGEAYRARGELKLAEHVYRDLIVDKDGTGRAGPFADASYVPLAQTLLADDEPKNDDEAARLLREVLTGRLGGSATARYREALRELGEVHYRAGEYEEAIERLEEYLARVEEYESAGGMEAEGARAAAAHGAGHASSLELVRYRLADAYRLSARGIEKLLATALPDSEVRQLRQTAKERLTRAGALFERVAEELGAVEHLGALEEVCLRNAYFYRGDCAFDLKDYDTAIRHYDAARERYPKDPAALVAMTQIVAALLAQGDLDRARIANERARKFYESLPDSVWDDPDLPMSRQDWERWLSSQARIAGAADE